MTTEPRSFKKSLASDEWPCQWDAIDANMCKDNREPLKILLELSENEMLQSLPSSNPGHSPSNTATASRGDMQRLCITSTLLGQHVASAWFCNFRLTCLSSLFRLLVLPCLGFFPHLSFWYNRHRISLTGEGLETTDSSSSAMKIGSSFVKS